jgi:gliding motility-associated-like protein
MRSSFTLALICCLAQVVLHGQSFTNRYISNADPSFSAIAALPNGDIVAGGAGFEGGGRGLVVGLAPSGGVLWRRYYGGAGGAWGVSSLQPTADGNILALFSIGQGGLLPSLNAYSVIAKLSRQDGAVLWAKRLGNDTRRGFYTRILPVSDGYILCGGVEEFGQQASYSLVKIAEDGSLLWQRSWQEGTRFGFFRDVVADEDGRLWALGRSVENSNIATPALLARFSPAGELELAQSLISNDAQRLFDAVHLAYVPGRGPVLTGAYYLVQGPAESQPVILQADPDGNILWAKRWDTPPGAYANLWARPLPDESLIVACTGTGSAEFAILARLDESGEPAWAHSLTADWGVEAANDFALDAEGNLLGVGIAFAPLPQLSRSAVVFKTDDFRFDAPSCCTSPVEVGSNPLEIAIAPPLNLQEGLALALADFSLPASIAPLVLVPVCRADELAIVLSDTLICPGQCVQISLSGVPPGTEAQWVFISGQRDTILNPGPIDACPSAEQTLQIQAFVNGCNRAERSLRVENRLPPPFMMSDSLICPGECLELSIPEPVDGDSYFWVFEGADQDSAFGISPLPICFPDGGQFFIELWLEGCGQRQQPIQVAYRPPGVPNAFTPNGDGLNDFFSPLFPCQVDDYELQIYNRWGEKVFQSAQLADAWDGNFKGKPVPAEVYFWLLRYTENFNGQPTSRMMQGDVTLLR